jgi:carbamoyltransferase
VEAGDGNSTLNLNLFSFYRCVAVSTVGSPVATIMVVFDQGEITEEHLLVLGYSGHRRHGWKGSAERKLASRLRHARQHSTLFDAVTSFGEDIEDLPLNLFPLDGVGHDSAAAILSFGSVLAAAAEERFTRFKHATGPGGNTIPPRQASAFCLTMAGARLDDVEHIAFYCDFTANALQQRIDAIRPHLSAPAAERVLSAYRRVYEDTVSNDRIVEEIEEVFGQQPRATLHFVPHHLAHAACAFYSSGYSESGILTIDGFGEKSSSIFAIGGKEGIRVIEETMLPGSLGVLYMMITAYLGFKPLDGEYKVMGLASYGNPQTYAKQFEQLFEEDSGGTCRTTALAREHFGEQIKNLFGPARKANDAVTSREMDIAAALQRSFEDAMLRRFAYLRATYNIERICLAGGGALNVVMTGKLARSRLFKETYVFPASGDDGASVGAAQYVYHQVLGHQSPRKPLHTMSLGPSYTEPELVRALTIFEAKISFHRVDNIEEEVASALAAGRVVGWFRGRMEFGPRALGNRSILADPRTLEMRDVVNNRVKHREEFRPFAPAVMAEHAKTYFDMQGVGCSDFMEFVVPATAIGCQSAQAVVHFDGSARLQTVSRQNNKPFWKVINEFNRLTGVPIVLNTSFNVRGEAIVCTPEDAIRCFLSTDIDLLALENYLVVKCAGKVLEEDMAIPAVGD